MAAGVAIGTVGEVPGYQLQCLELVAGKEHAGGGFRQQAAIGGTEHRGFHPLFAIAQHGR
ncbi:hypothetical protein D3C75_1348340 [compost metagenome]